MKTGPMEKSFRVSMWNLSIQDKNCGETREWRWICLLQLFFFLTALIGLDSPLVSADNGRQNHTFDLARHVYREGWSAVVQPKTSFSMEENLAQPFTVVHLEFPFHGLLGYPAAVLLKNHDYAIARLVSIIFVLISFRFGYAVFRHWLPPQAALIGITLWATAPLVLHFGQVPMPDVLATTGMIAAFACSLRGTWISSSLWFAFALLAKSSSIVFGLPILMALLVVKESLSFPKFPGLAVAWGFVPLLSLVGWLALGRGSPPGSWTIWSMYEDGTYAGLTDFAVFDQYLHFLEYLVPVGCGILGILGLAFAFHKNAPRMDRWIGGAIFLAILSCYLGESRMMWREPQYTLPVLFWLILAVSFGIPPLLEKMRVSRLWRIGVIAVLVVQIVSVSSAIFFLKSSRVSNWNDLQAAAGLLPPNARVVVVSSIYLGTSSSVWLDRNVFEIDFRATKRSFPGEDLQALAELKRNLGNLEAAGFRYLMVFDYRIYTNKTKAGYATYFTLPSSPLRHFCDDRFDKLFEGNHVLLYALQDSKPSKSQQ